MSSTPRKSLESHDTEVLKQVFGMKPIPKSAWDKLNKSAVDRAEEKIKADKRRRDFNREHYGDEEGLPEHLRYGGRKRKTKGRKTKRRKTKGRKTRRRKH